MRDFFVALFGTTEGPLEITLFSVWHFLYLFLIIGGTIGAAFALRGRSKEVTTKVLNVLSISVVALYAADFFIMPLSEASNHIATDKLPFHVCTLTGVFSAFAQFNKKFAPVKDVIACLAIVATLMYMTYPGSAIGDRTPYCYKVVQTFLFHGALFAWGVLSVTTGAVEFSFKNIWKEFVAIALVIIWAMLGNAIYSFEGEVYDWFFVAGHTFPFVPTPLMPLAVLAAVGGMCAIIFSIDLLVKRILQKNASNATPFTEQSRIN